MKRVLITGATSGLGLQLAKDYQAQGWQVIACGRNQEQLERLKEQGMTTLCFDVTNLEPLEDWVKGAKEPLDTLILNAGICDYIDDGNLSAAVFEKTMSVNLVAPVALIEILLPMLQRAQTPQIAFIGSASVYLPFARAEAYGSSKAALRYLALTLHNTLKPHGVHVCLVTLGFIDTPLTQKNDFAMPGIVTAEQASQAIREGLAKRKCQICYPVLFCTLLRAIEKLPTRVKLAIAHKLMLKEK